MNFIEGLVFGLMSLRESKKAEKAAHIPVSTSRPHYGSFLKEKSYIKSMDLIVPDRYTQFNTDFFDSVADIYETKIDTIDGNSFSEETKNRLRYLYTVANADRGSLKKQTELICELIKVNRMTGEPTEQMLHNELLYVIDMYAPKDDVERAIRQLCVFLDGEYFFYQGNYKNALKRFYKALDWDKILLNGQIIETYEMNGLEEIYAAAVVNIINIYALLGLSEKTEETRRAFNALYDLMCRAVFVKPQLDSEDKNRMIVEYQEKIRAAFYATDELKGFFSYISNATETTDMFYGCHLGNFGDEDMFSIPMNFVSEITRLDVFGIRNGIIGTYPGLRICDCGCIIDFEFKAKEQCREIEGLFNTKQ